MTQFEAQATVVARSEVATIGYDRALTFWCYEAESVAEIQDPYRQYARDVRNAIANLHTPEHLS